MFRNARHVPFGAEAGIHQSAFLDWPGNHHDDDERLDKLVPAGRWNLVWESLVARSPIGVRISRGYEDTAVIGLSSQINGQAISDSARRTLVEGMTESR
ncbi:MAG: hypothetical protein ACYC0X_17795 [Pirellulaceae bacterium]